MLPLTAAFSALAALSDLTLPELPDSGFEVAARAPFHEASDWVVELASSLPFKELLRYRFKASGINVLEARTYKTWIKHLAHKQPACRAVALLDSRVTLGAAAKGRSSSPAISRCCRALCLTFWALPVSRRLARPDSLKSWGRPLPVRPVRPPSRDLPAWFELLQRGQTWRFDVMISCSSFPRPLGRWLRLLLLLAGDVERQPGPVRQPLPRGPLDLQSGFTALTAARMAKCFDAFLTWLRDEACLDFAAISSSPEPFALALRAYGLHLYQVGLPRYLLVYAITACQDRFPHMRLAFGPAWQIDRKWQHSEPGECRPVISVPIMLHPAEFLGLRRSDLVLPSDAMSADRIAYIYLRNPKTARFARRQHCRLEDATVLQFLEAFYGQRSKAFALYAGSAHVYRAQWNAVMNFLGVPCRRDQRGATPGVLRGSGATYLYLETEDVTKVAWRGRWARLKTVGFYLQEVAAQVLLASLSEGVRQRIRFFRRFAKPLLELASQSAAR